MVLMWSGGNQKKNAPAKAQYEHKIDSAKTAAEDSIQSVQETTAFAAVTQQDSLKPLFPAMYGTESTTVLDNGLVRIGISSKGAVPVFATLSGYNDQQGNNVTLFSRNEISLNFLLSYLSVFSVPLALAEVKGIEPLQTESKTVTLPLGYTSVYVFIITTTPRFPARNTTRPTESSRGSPATRRTRRCRFA